MSVHMKKTVLDDGYIMVDAYGKSTDSKPSFDGMASGSTYTAVDTGKAYMYEEDEPKWYEVGGTSDSSSGTGGES